MKPFDFLNGAISNLCKLTIPDGRQGTVTKNSLNTKMTISQEPMVEIDPTLCQNVSCMKLFFYCSLALIPRWPSFAVTKNNTERENDNISITA